MRILLLAAAATVFAASAPAAEIITPENAIPNRYIVVLHEEQEVARMTVEARVDRVTRVATEAMTRSGGTLQHVYQRALYGFVAEFNEQQVRAMARDPRVRYIEQDAVMRVAATQSNATWGLDRIDQRDLPIDAVYNYDFTGAGVHAYVIDTGIRATHQEFAGRIGAGFSAIAGGTEDCNGHGTHVSGTIGGTTYGVAKQVMLHPVRVLDCKGFGATTGVIQGVDWVTMHHVKPAVANMSLSGSISTALDDAVLNSIRAGIVYAVAAANSNRDACNASPGRVKEALTAGASTNQDTRASFSNFGVCVDLFAPGAEITSSWFSSDTATAVLSGTSMASPHVAGAAALVLEANSGATPAEVARTLSNTASVDKLTSIGTGSPNRLLYSAAAQTPPGPDPAPVAAYTFICNHLVCRFDARASTDDGTLSNFAWNFGDRQTGSGAIVSHTFGSAGTFTVDLTVTDSVGQIDTETKSVSVPDNGPEAPCTDCTRYVGTLAPGEKQFQPDGVSYVGKPNGTHRAWLRAPVGTEFDLALLTLDIFFGWLPVALDIGPTPDKQITYTSPPGGLPRLYLWSITAATGQGPYEFFLQQPQ